MKGRLKLLGGKNLQSPKGLLSRPTTSIIREAVINILRSNLNNCHWLDICSGSGAMACEALQMGARRIVSIEQNKEIAKVCKSNLFSTASDLTHKYFIEVIPSETISFLKRGCKQKSLKFNKHFPDYDSRFDFVYLDPPYNSNLYQLIIENLIIGEWIKEDGLVICEYSTNLIPEFPSKWNKVNQKRYGDTELAFITPNQASHFPDDTDSKPPQKDQE